MFTGIVTEVGNVIAVEPTETGRRLVIEAPVTVDRLSIGDSVAVDGVCLTAVEVGDRSFVVEAVGETLERTTLGGFAEGTPVDLERPVPSEGGRFDGHVVQGHADGVGVVEAITAEGEARRVRISAPTRLAQYFVEKGSVSLEGVSLTITAVSPTSAEHAWLEVVLIPHTLEVTVLGERSVGDEVNIEADIFAKYIERLLEAQA
jgi:riboflavin synthase alpha subunit